jgi:UDP-N-acetylglucosamine:LPS N-acetylglucosamine transferase
VKRRARGRPKILLVSSIGGHLTDLLALGEAYTGYERVWVLQDRSPVLPAGERGYIVAHAERDWRVLWNFIELAAIIGRERPDVILSAGAGVAVPAAVWARLAGIPFVFVEPCSAVARLTLTGRLVRRLATSFFVQWPALARKVGARYEGGLL